MELFKIFQKPVVLHCYTNLAAIYNFYPIKSGTAYIPDWWKQIPKNLVLENNFFPTATMKNCVGFTDFFKNSFALPLWSDVSIAIGQNGSTDYKYQFSDCQSKINAHPQFQRGEAFSEKEFQHLKFETPWRFICEEEISFLQTGAFWNQNDFSEMQITPGVINFKYQNGINVNTLWKRQPKEKIYHLQENMPFCFLFPLTERKIKLKIHLISDEDFNNLTNLTYRSSFFGKYKTNQRNLQERGCPFHFKAEK